MISSNEESFRARKSEQKSGQWQLPVGLFVALGCVITAAYAVAETFWG